MSWLATELKSSCLSLSWNDMERHEHWMLPLLCQLEGRMSFLAFLAFTAEASETLQFYSSRVIVNESIEE